MSVNDKKMGKVMLVRFYEDLLERKKIRKNGASHKRMLGLIDDLNRFKKNGSYYYKKLFLTKNKKETK